MKAGANGRTGAPPSDRQVRRADRLGRNLVLLYLRRQAAPLSLKLAIPSVLGAVLLLVLGASVGFAFTQVSHQANALVVENARSADATRLRIEVRSVMDAAQAALDNNDRATLARLFQQRSRLRAAIAAASRDLASLPPEDQVRLDTVRTVIGPLDTMAGLLQTGYLDTAQGLWDRQIYDDMATAVTAAAEFGRSSAERARAAAAGNLEAIRIAALLSAFVLGLALLALPLFGWLTHGLVVVPIEEVTRALGRVAAGDLTARLKLYHKDEFGQLEHSFNDMATALALLLESARSGEAGGAGGASALLRSAQAAAGRVSRAANELEQAYRIQSALLPSSAQMLPGWRVDAARIPATELGGDFYDLLNLPGGRLGLVIGDVSGHGAASALIAAWTQGMLALAAADDSDPGSVLARVNELLRARLPERMFVTLAYAVLDPQRGVLEYANAGQCYPLIRLAPGSSVHGSVRSASLGEHTTTPTISRRMMEPPLANDTDAGWRWLELPGLPLGAMPGVRYSTARFPLTTVQGFIIYSDGIVETRDRAGTFYGFTRLQEICETLLPDSGDPDAPAPPDGVAEQILQSALAYGTVLRPEDDMTVLVMQRGGSDSLPATLDNRYFTAADVAPAGAAGG